MSRNTTTGHFWTDSKGNEVEARTVIIDAVISSDLTHHWGRHEVAMWIVALEEEGWDLNNIIELSCPIPQAIPEDADPQPEVLAQRYLDWVSDPATTKRAYPSPQVVIRGLLLRNRL